MFAVWCVVKPRAARLGLTRVLGHARRAKLARWLVLGRVAAPGARLSAVRWADPHAGAETLGWVRCDDADRSAAVAALAPRQAQRDDPRSRV